MAWTEQRARARIMELRSKAPKVRVERFETEYLKDYRDRGVVLARNGQRQAPPLFELGRDRAVVAHTIQIYVGIVNFDEFRIENEGETERAHKRMLQLKHVLYSACDRVAEQCDVQRVDFHGSRMHAVVLSSNPNGVTIEDVGKAFRFVTLFSELAGRAIRDLGADDMVAQFRFGVDAGLCVAIDNGTALEREPMFLGSPANHAAKLAEGSKAGIYVSDGIRIALGNAAVGSTFESFLPIEQSSVTRAINARSASLGTMAFAEDQRSQTVATLLDDWKGEIARREVPDPTDPTFTFHDQPLPLSQIKFAELSPSQSLRLPLASIFADISGYTAYIDAAVQQGGVADAVRALYVVRAEFQNVIEKDFGGRKVRFIGDCIHAVLADGAAATAEPRHSVATAILAAAALHASFGVCQSLLSDTRRLGLAIGLEHGVTPITRLGIRGVRSVRVASSVACCQSEKEQRSLPTNGVRVGPRAFELMPASFRPLFDPDGSTDVLDYDDVCTSAGKVAAAAATPAAVVRSPVVHSPHIGRAHFKG